MRRRTIGGIIGALAAAAAAAGCTVTERHRALPTQAVWSYRTPYDGPTYTLAIGQFQNRSPYMNGLLADGTDRLGKQARQNLKTHLVQSGRLLFPVPRALSPNGRSDRFTSMAPSSIIESTSAAAPLRR